MKTILKALYIGVVLIFACLFFMGTYNNSVSTNLQKVLSASIKEYDETGDMGALAQCFGIWENPTDKTPVVSKSLGDKDTHLAIYSTENQYLAEYTDSNSQEQYVERVEGVYLFLIMHPTFDRLDLSDKTNKAGIELINADGKSYVYLFDQNEEVNTDKYISSPTTEKEAVLNEERDYCNNYIDNGFDLIFSSISKTVMDMIVADELDGKPVTKVNILDNLGKEVYSEDIDAKLDYSQQFFTDLAQFAVYVNDYNLYANKKDSTYKEGYDIAKPFVEGYFTDVESVLPGFSQNYMKGIAKSQVFTGAPLIFASIGYTTLFLFVFAIIYILFFHFDLIRGLFLRLSQIGKSTNSDTKKDKKKAPEKVRNISKEEDEPFVEPQVNAQFMSQLEATNTKPAAEEPVVEEAPAVEEVVEEAPVEEVVEETPAEEAKEE